ncbi:YegP family protein [Pseudonocardia sp. DLS-67]
MKGTKMAGKFEVYKDRAGKFRFRLKASNGQVVATGEAYETKASALKGCESVQKAADGAPVVEVDS